LRGVRKCLSNGGIGAKVVVFSENNTGDLAVDLTFEEHMKQEEKAANSLQTLARRILAVKAVKKFRKVKKRELHGLNRAAAMMQKYGRRSQARVKVRKLRREQAIALAVQYCITTAVVSISNQIKVCMCTKIQSQIRQKLCRLQYKQELGLWTDAATQLQRQFRGIIQRGKTAAMRELFLFHCTVIQKHFRTNLAKLVILARNQASTQIQAMFRGNTTRLNMRDIMESSELRFEHPSLEPGLQGKFIFAFESFRHFGWKWVPIRYRLPHTAPKVRLPACIELCPSLVSFPHCDDQFFVL
jgi:hypothetical protein